MNYTSKLTPANFATLALGLESLPKEQKAVFKATVMRSKTRAHTIHICRPYGAKLPQFYSFVDPTGKALKESDKQILKALWSEMDAAGGKMHGGSFRISVREDGYVSASNHLASVAHKSAGAIAEDEAEEEV